MKYLAIEIKGGVHVMNNHDELGGLIDNGIHHRVLGTICDSQNYGDNCTTDCIMYARGTCRAQRVCDINGQFWHVVPY